MSSYGIWITDTGAGKGAWLKKNDGELFHYPEKAIASAHIEDMKSGPDRSWEKSIAALCEAKAFTNKGAD